VNIALGIVGLSLIGVAGCGASSDSADVGKVGDKAKATRVIEIRMLDTLRFEPASVAVKPNETVTLRVTNTATLIHEFLLGNAKTQDDHDSQMKSMGAEPMKMRDTPNNLNIDPGTTEEITWTFPAKGKVEFGCHQPGHYAKGMEGVVNIA